MKNETGDLVAMSSVAIAVPLHLRNHFTSDEEVSLRHLTHYLGSYDRFLVSPRSLSVQLPGFGVKQFSDRYFGSAEANKRLLLSRRFYESFTQYDYVLVYHLDALVFSDELEDWCNQNWDYIGAPWLVDPEDPEAGFSEVGNGGFSLRRVESFLRIFDSKKYRIHPERYRRKFLQARSGLNRLVNAPRLVLKRLVLLNGVRWEMRRYRPNEDGFWSKRAQHYDPSFRIPAAQRALEFAFECAPRHCFEINGRQLPFGCHAWPRYDRAFWEPFLLNA